MIAKVSKARPSATLGPPGNQPSTWESKHPIVRQVFSDQGFEHLKLKQFSDDVFSQYNLIQ